VRQLPRSLSLPSARIEQSARVRQFPFEHFAWPDAGARGYTSVCSLAFSDTLVPTGTFYTVSFVNKNGSIVAGFPQTWCTYGGVTGTPAGSPHPQLPIGSWRQSHGQLQICSWEEDANMAGKAREKFSVPCSVPKLANQVT
jgi:hypothetical protein